MRRLLSIAIIASLSGYPALAATSIRLTDQFELPANSMVHISVPVGSLVANTHRSNEIKLSVIVKPGADSVPVEDPAFQPKVSKYIEDKRAFVEIAQVNTIQNWTVTLPLSANVKLDMGVGEVEIENVTRNIEVDVGVGEVDLTLVTKDYNRIDLDSNVGTVALDGFNATAQKRATVSETFKWRGEGRHQIDIDVGVGKIAVQF